jgi:hypothetical protein
MTTETFTWIGGSGNWATASDWNPLGPPTASSLASIGGTTAETVLVNDPEAVTAVVLNNPNGSLGIGGATGARLTVANTVAIEEGTLLIGGRGTLDAAHIRIAAPAGSTTRTNGVLLFLSGGTINATVQNNGTIKAGAAGTIVDFERKVVGTGSADISGGGTLEFTKRVQQTINFGTGGGTLDLLDPLHQSGHITGFATGDTISMAGDWAFGSLTHPTHATTDLTLTSGSEIHSLVFKGTFSKGDFNIASGTTSTTINFA